MAEFESDLPEAPADDESNSVDIAGPIRITLDVDGLTWDEIHHIESVAQSFVEVVGGDIVITDGPVPDDGTTEELEDGNSGTD